ncbi:MAG: hypothetical protein FWD48_03720 [Oscillospiraceae bacterium]|nr:hypothetical protein [Oscillospiraceae bacterium]
MSKTRKAFKIFLISSGIVILLIIILFSLMLMFFLRMMFIMPRGYFDGMKSVDIKEIGVLKIPEEWVVTWENDVLFITDKPLHENDYKYYLIGVVEYNYDGKFFSALNELFGEVEYVNHVRSFSGGISGERGYLAEYNINGNIVEKYYIETLIGAGTSNFLKLISWDNLIDEETLIIISRSRFSEIRIPAFLIVLIVIEFVIVFLLIKLKRKKLNA